MKQLFFSMVLVLAVSANAIAQNTNPKIIAVVNKASWCHVCKANGPRVEKDLMPMLMKNNDVLVVVNDLSDDKTKEASKAMIKKTGISNFTKKKTGTGMIYFLDAKSKKLISTISLAKSNDEIKMAFMNALSKS
jgi:hypothetical protein